MLGRLEFGGLEQVFETGHYRGFGNGFNSRRWCYGSIGQTCGILAGGG
jgi:hypothetical protein